MYKAISLLVISATLIALALSGCSPQVAEEETTDNSSIISAIDNSSPITKGNLITKTNTDENGNININYFDSKGNLVENFVWDDDEKISHSLMTYSDSDKLIQKEELSPDGQQNKVESYQYDSDNNLQQKTVSEFEAGKLTVSTIYSSDNTITSKSLSFYNDAGKLHKIERYDSQDNLEEYYTYEYNNNGQTIKYSAYDADETLLKYTTFEYNDNGMLKFERFFDKDNNPDGYYAFTYHESGNMKSSAKYDSDGKLLSEDFFEDSVNS